MPRCLKTETIQRRWSDENETELKPKLKPKIALDENSVDKNSSFSYGASPTISDFSATCHPTQVNAPRLNPSQ